MFFRKYGTSEARNAARASFTCVRGGLPSLLDGITHAVPRRPPTMFTDLEDYYPEATGRDVLLCSAVSAFVAVLGLKPVIRVTRTYGCPTS